MADTDWLAEGVQIRETTDQEWLAEGVQVRETTAAAGGLDIAIAMHHYLQIMGVH